MSQESQQAASYCNSPEFGLMDLQEDSQESYEPYMLLQLVLNTAQESCQQP